MTKMSMEYLGELQTKLTHKGNLSEIETEAPIDNGGKGRKFSPTDLMCASLVSCMTTIMAIYAKKNEIELGKIDADFEKTMYSNPRRVGEIKINFKVEDRSYSEKNKKALENAALTCPVAKSISENIVLNVSFEFI